MSDVHAHEPTLFPDLAPPVAEGRGRYRPRARLLKTIGAELISSEVVAVIELVRNCYDADATIVEVVFDYPEDPGRATLGIRDNGHGMSLEVFEKAWMEPATDFKSGARVEGGTGGDRSPAGRRRLGSKGVGRFAAQRLGTQLDMATRAAGGSTEVLAHFDWRTLEGDDYLEQLTVPWRQGPAERLQEQGTHLAVSRLRDVWSPERFERLRLGLARLVSPTMKEDFQIRMVINGAVEEIKPALDASAAMYGIEGTVEDGGRCTIRYRDINGDTETWERSVFWPREAAQQCGPFSFRINAWDLDREPLKLFLKQTGSKLGLRDFRKLIRDHSGVSLYRDGFRILPYGEPDNDWLRLDHRRVNNPTMRLSNNQILGALQLSADINPNLKDQTNREGLVTNEAYNHLAEVVVELLGYLETRRFAARRAMDIDWQRRTSSLPEIHDDGTSSKIDVLIDRLASGSTGKTEHAKELRLEVRDFRDATADAVRHYAGLAAAGQLSGLVFRQLEHPMRQMRSELSLVLNDLACDGLDADDLDDLRVSVRRAIQHLDTMNKRMNTLDPLAVGGRGRRVSDQQLNELLLTVIEPFYDEFNRLGVALDFQGDESVRVRTNREVAQQVMANLLENALWFASKGDASTPTVTVIVREGGFTVSDNGLGVPDKNRAVIFEPHFTTRDGAHGLGLTLVRDLIRSVGGRVRLSTTCPATFRITFG